MIKFTIFQPLKILEHLVIYHDINASCTKFEACFIIKFTISNSKAPIKWTINPQYTRTHQPSKATITNPNWQKPNWKTLETEQTQFTHSTNSHKETKKKSSKKIETDMGFSPTEELQLHGEPKKGLRIHQRDHSKQA